MQFRFQAGEMLAYDTLVKLKVVRIIHPIMSGNDADVSLVRNCHIPPRGLSINSQENSTR